jgi:hypothetical protein
VHLGLGTKGVEHVAPFAGLDATTFTAASNAATIFSGLPSLYNHELPGATANTVLADLRKRLLVINDAIVLTIPPPPVQGLGSAGGFKMMLEDRAGLGSEALAKAARALVAAANKDANFAGVFTLFTTGSPSVYADIDRLKAEKVGLTPTRPRWRPSRRCTVPLKPFWTWTAHVVKFRSITTPHYDAYEFSTKDQKIHPPYSPTTLHRGNSRKCIWLSEGGCWAVLW